MKQPASLHASAQAPAPAQADSEIYKTTL